MANKLVKNSPTGAMGIIAAKRARYERSEVAYGKIPAAAYAVGDVLVFDAIPAKEIIHARFVADATSPVELEIFVGTDLSSAIAFDLADGGDTADINYVVIYRKGNTTGLDKQIKLTMASSGS